MTITPTEATPRLQAWQGNLVDVTDVVETQKSEDAPDLRGRQRLFAMTASQRSGAAFYWKSRTRPR